MPQRKQNVVVVDYQAGNLFSIENACKSVGLNPVFTNNTKEIFKADALILPGVGAFGEAMINIRRLDLVQPLREFAECGKPLMGICLGMQLLFSESQEFGHHKGLDVIKGYVAKFPVNGFRHEKIRVPQMGWNQIISPSFNDSSYWDGSPLEKIKSGEFMYFVHSFYVMPESTDNFLAITNYADIEYASGVIKENVWGFQFHPEKSGSEGLKIFKNFKDIIVGDCHD